MIRKIKGLAANGGLLSAMEDYGKQVFESFGTVGAYELA